MKKRTHLRARELAVSYAKRSIRYPATGEEYLAEGYRAGYMAALRKVRSELKKGDETTLRHLLRFGT